MTEVQSSLQASNASAVSNNPMFNLSCTTIAIMELITRYLSGLDLMALYGTCSHSLIMRLRAGGAKQFIINHTTPRNPNANFFGCIKLLNNLHTVSLQQSTLHVWNTGPQLLLALPPALRSLTLCLPLQFADWLMIRPCGTIKHKKSSKLIAAPREKFSVRSHHDMPEFHMAQWFPKLEELNITGGVRWGGKRYVSEETAMKVKSRFLKSLPLSLSKIIMPDMGPLTWKSYQLLPPSLHSLLLTCHSTQIPTTGFQGLPANLTSLELETSHCPSNEADTTYLFKSLPKTLEKLSWTVASTYNVGRPNACSLEGLEATSLTHLYIGATAFSLEHHHIFELLPPTLESLELHLYEAPLNYDASFAHLPRKLSKLVIHTTRLMQRISYLPAIGLKEMPSHLTHLELENLCVLQDQDFADFPRTLKTLRLQINPVSFPNHDCRVLLCQAQCAPALEDTRVAHSIGALTDNCSAYLPSTLTSLRVTNTSFDASFFNGLPRALTYLEVETSSKLSAEAFAELPSTLLTLSILGKSNDWNSAALTSLNAPNLQTLEIQRTPWSFRDEQLLHLPRSLTHLHLGGSVWFSDFGVLNLPRNLVSLSMPESDQLSAACAPYLPRTLKVFIVGKFLMPSQRPIKAKILSDMPHTVKTYDLPWYTAKGRKVDFSVQS